MDGGVPATLAAFVEDQGAGRYRFQHALMRDAAETPVPATEGAHARVGNAILAPTPDPGGGALLHFFLAGDDRLAWRYSVIAARRAESAYATSRPLGSSGRRSTPDVVSRR